MAKVKVIYGTPAAQPAFWAYAVNDKGSAVIVRCASLVEAVDEVQRMKQSDARKVGYTVRKVSELTMREQVKDKGWKLSLVR